MCEIRGQESSPMQLTYRLVLVLLLLLSVAAEAQSLTELRTTQEKLTSEQEELISDWLTKRVPMMADKDKLAQAIDARSEILVQSEGATQIFRSAYAANLNDVLKAELNRQKENELLAFNAAFCLAQLQPSSSDLLKDLLGHKSAAVRYWAVKGLVGLLAAKNSSDSPRIIRILAAAATKESSSVVLAQVYASLTKASPELSLDALSNVMDARLKGYQAAKVVGPQAELQAIATSDKLWSKLDQNQQNDLAQRLGQLMTFSGLRYTRNYAELTPRLRTQLEQIVISTEALLSRMAQARKTKLGTPISKALRSERDDRLDRVSAALDAWTGSAGAERYHLQIFNAQPLKPLQ